MEKLLLKKCKIIPLEGVEALITSITITTWGVEIRCKYYADSEAKYVDVYDFEIEMIKEK